jgi:hypothetical protein
VRFLQPLLYVVAGFHAQVVCMYLSHETVLCAGGRVVGKQGLIIMNIQRESKVKLMHALAPVGNSLWTVVVIMGQPACILTAYKAVADIVANGQLVYCCSYWGL